MIVLVLLHTHSHGSLQRYGGLAKRLPRSTSLSSKKKFLKSKKSFGTRKKFVRFYSTKTTPPEQNNQQYQNKGLFGYLSAWFGAKFTKPRETALYAEHVKILDEMFHVVDKNHPQETLLPENRKSEIRALHKQLFDRMIDAQKNGEVVLLNNIPRVRRICFELEKSKINKEGTGTQKKWINDPFTILTFVNPLVTLPLDWETCLLYKDPFRKLQHEDPFDYVTSVMGRLFYYPMRRKDLDLPAETTRFFSNIDNRMGDLDLHIRYERQIEIIDTIKKYSNYSGTFPYQHSNSEIVALILKKNNPLLKEYPNLKKWKYSTLIFDEKRDMNLTIDPNLLQNKNFKATSELFISHINPINETDMQNLENEIEQIIRGFKERQRHSNEQQREERQERQKSSKITRQEAFRRLGISENTPLQEIKRTFLKLAKENHPDRYRDPVLKDEANKKLRELIEAYHVLIEK